MFSSIKPWINVPYQYKPFTKYSGSGTKMYDGVVDSFCYPSSDIKVVTDMNGVEVTSTGHLYVPGDEPIKYSDMVVFEGREREILRINTYYRKGVPDVKVVYI